MATDPNPTFDDRYLARLEVFTAVATEIIDVLSMMIAAAEEGRAALDAGRSAADLVLESMSSGGPDIRKHLHTRLRELERSLQLLRGESFRIVVEGGHVTITEAARRGAISVQMARRLYTAAVEDSLSAERTSAPD